MIRHLAIAAMLAGTIGSISIEAAAAPGVRAAPPAPRSETVPESRRGYHWVAGHWEWRADNRRYRWVAGHWVRDRRGYVYRQPTWEERNGRWHMTRGSWDRDRDGIPNRVDRDRDGDGVRNSQDRRPDNPRKQ